MRIPRFVSAIVVLLAALAVPYWSQPETAWADGGRPSQMFIIVADGAAIRDSVENTYLTRSLMGLLATLKADHRFAVVPVEDPSDVMGPFGAGEFQSSGIQYKYVIRLDSMETDEGGRFADALAEAHALLGSERAAIGSAVYVLAGSSPDTDFDRQYRRMVPLLARFKEKGWHIDGIGLPGASADAVGFLDKIASGSGGRAFELAVDPGYRDLTDSILTQGAKGSISPAGRHTLRNNDLMTSFINVAPGTREITLLFFKESPLGSLRLSNPDGFEVSAGDRTSSYVIETPHVVTWKLTDPVPGQWQVEARGMEGVISAWEYSSNKYSIVLSAPAPVPLDQATTMAAYVTDGVQLVALEGVRLFARVTTPDGTILVHEMNDEGVDGDADAGDGYFTATLAPIRVAGEYEVEFDLSWAEHEHRLLSRHTFAAQAFPAVEIRPYELDDIVPGERTKVATVFVHVQGQPYAVNVDQLTVSQGVDPDEKLALLLAARQEQPAGADVLQPPSASPTGAAPIVELEPRRLFGDGPAWEFDVFVTAQGEGARTVVFKLGLEYAGTEYTDSTQSIVVRSATPPAPVEPRVVNAVEAKPVAASPVTRPLSVVQTMAEPSGFPWVLLALGLFLAGGLVAAVVYMLTRTRPYGFLYNDLDEPLVDFSKVERHPLLRFFLKGSIRGSELNVPELDRVVFQFSRSRVKLQSLGDHPTVRVNNQPLIKQATIGDRSWIGTGGRLFNFLLSPIPAQGTAGAD